MRYLYGAGGRTVAPGQGAWVRAAWVRAAGQGRAGITTAPRPSPFKIPLQAARRRSTCWPCKDIQSKP
jgi:hypothetical protein